MNANPGAFTHAPISASFRLGLLLLCVMLGVHFVASTKEVRIANSDDIRFSKFGLSPEPGALSADLTQEGVLGGRFYYALPPYQASNLSFEVANPWIFASIRGVLFLAQWALLGWLVARLTGSEAAGWLCFIFSVCAVHFAPFYNAVLSHPEYAVGSSALFLALHSYLSYVTTSRPAWRWLACAAYAWALLNHENFVVFFPLFWAMDGYSGPVRRPYRQVLARSWPILAVIASYLLAYLDFRRRYPSAYNGTQFSIRPVAALTAWVRLNLGAVPGVELFLARRFPAPEKGPLLRSAGEIVSVFSHAPATGWVLALAAALCAARLLQPAIDSSARPSGRALACFVWAIAASNLLVSFVAKYQLLVYHRYFPYYYSISTYGWAVAAAVCMLGLLPRRTNAQSRRLWLGWAVPLFLVFASASASNAESIRKLILWYN